MLEEVVKDYASYLKLDVSSGFQSVQDVIDNMLTRLEELSSVLQIVKTKNSDCSLSVTDDISKFRSEITTLSKKVLTINEVIIKLQQNIDILERQILKAEADFGINNDNKIKSLFKPFLLRTKVAAPDKTNPVIMPPQKIYLQSTLDHFDGDSNEDL